MRTKDKISYYFVPYKRKLQTFKLSDFLLRDTFFLWIIILLKLKKKKKADPLYTKSKQESWGLSCYYNQENKSDLGSIRFPDWKLGTYTITQSKRDFKNEDLRNSILVSLSPKSRQFISLQMLYIKRVGLDVPLFVERYFLFFFFFW